MGVGGGSSGAASRAIASAAGGAGVGVGSPAGKYSGGNSYNPQPTPDWQKKMTSFLIKSDLDKESSVEEDDLATKKKIVKAKGKGQEEKENKENKSKMSKNG